MFDIDVVYLWCDGNDPHFIKRKNKYLRKECFKSEESSGNVRFYNNDELKYSLRSLEKYANWIHHVFIVTDQQIPSWLNLNNTRVSIVDHAEILPADIIPCFNSTVIERYLFNIPGLSEHFIYGNDDTFFGCMVSPDFFFTKDGKPIIRVRPFSDFREKLTRLNIDKVYKKVRFWGKSVINSWTMLLVQWKMNEVNMYELHHNFDAYLKSDYAQTYYKYKKYLDLSVNRFRSEKDINRILFDIELYMLGHGKLKVLRHINKREKIKSILLRKQIESYYLEKKLRSFLVFEMVKCKLFCINDLKSTNRFNNFLEKNC